MLPVSDAHIHFFSHRFFALLAGQKRDLTVDSIGNGLFAPLSLVYFVRLTDVPLALVGLLLTVANLVALPLPVWAGAVADRIGPRPPVAAAEAAMALGFLAFAAVTGPVGILAASVLVAVGVRVFWCTIFTLVADYADGRPGGAGVDTWYAISNAARTAGLALGGLATGFVVADGSAAGYRAVAYGAAAFLALAALLVAVGVRAPLQAGAADRPAGYRELVRDRPYLGLVALNTVYAMTSMMLALALPTIVLAGAGPAWLTSVLLAANAVLIAALSAPVVRRLGGVRRTRSIAAAAALWVLWCGMLALVGVSGGTTATVVLIVGTLLFTAAEAIHAPISTAAAAGAAPAAARGRYLAAFQYSFAVASVIAPAFFGGLYAAGHALPFLVLGLVNALSVPAVLRLERALPTLALRS
jgi:MFS family permease